jgi:hypothetical protein
VHWRPEAASRDLVYVDIDSARTGVIVRCAFADTGEGVVPGSLLEPSVLGPFSSSASFAVHRVRLGSFAASGIDVGEVRFDLATIGRATLQPADRL